MIRTLHILAVFAAFSSLSAQADDRWRVGADIFGSALGPVTYDRQDKSSVASGLDPQLTSSGLRLGLESVSSYGSLTLGLLGRYYQPVENRTHALYTGGAVAYNQITEIKAQGFGATVGWVLWPPAKNRILHPRASLVIERDHLSVRTKSRDSSNAVISDATEQSTLYAAYLDAGPRWRLLARPFEFNVTFSAVLPFFANASSDVNRHRTRPGLELGSSFVFDLPQNKDTP